MEVSGAYNKCTRRDIKTPSSYTYALTVWNTTGSCIVGVVLYWSDIYTHLMHLCFVPYTRYIYVCTSIVILSKPRTIRLCVVCTYVRVVADRGHSSLEALQQHSLASVI